MCLNEATPPASQPFVAALNSGQTAVNLNWGLPVNDYDLIYDDGIQDNFGIYLTGNGLNMNAVRFTPIGYPTIVKGFYLNIGTALNYPSGSNAFSPVQMSVYTEVNGLPGVPIATTVTTVTPGPNYGWYKANFANPATITSGNFFIVMSQLGSSTATPGIAIDTTVYQMRSYSKMQNVPWLPAPGNYMIRAIVNGSGGPLMASGQPGKTITASPISGMIYEYTPSTVTGVEGSPKVYPEMGGFNPDNLVGYQVWRLLQGQELTPALWTSIATPTGTTAVDNSWPSLPCDPYEWAVEAQYTFNRWSTAAFSNALGKCWTCTVTVNVTLSCDSATTAGTVVTFTEPATPDSVYTRTMDATGTLVINNFWKGIYNLNVFKFDYTPYNQPNISIMGDMTFNVTLLQIREAPTGIAVHDQGLLVHYGPLVNWNPPVVSQTLLGETFSGGFGPNGWVPDAGSQWGINAYDGNPGNCAEWYYYPEQLNYSQSLTSKTLYGVHSPVLKLQYDLHLANVGTTTLEQLAVEVWNGTSWNSVANYDNSTGQNIAYETETVDISSVAPSTGFKIRFRAYGEDSINIDWWDIDNVYVLAQTLPGDKCIVGYEVYLNGVNDGYTPDTSYVIPASHVVFGTSYLVCAAAIYGSGYSALDCTSWTDHFLCPPDTVHAIALDCSALITWHKPNCGGCALKTYLLDAGFANDGYTAPAGYASSVARIGNYFPLGPYVSGVIKSFDAEFSSNSSSSAQTTAIYVYNTSHVLIGQSAPFVNTGATWPAGTMDHITSSDIAYSGPFYALVDMFVASGTSKNFFDLDNTTVGPTNLGYGWADIDGTWTYAVQSSIWAGADPRATFIERVNVCENSKKDAAMTTLDPSTMPVSQYAATPNSGIANHPGANLGAIIDGTVVGNTPVESPESPLANPILLGYNILRNGVIIGYLPYPDSLQYYDYNLAPGVYHYTVNAKYNTAPATPPWGPTDTSMSASPVASVQIACGYSLPFFEGWDNDSWSFQQWSFAPNQGNWSLNTAVGDPIPCADFSWEPVITNYSTSLITPNINASAWTCADIYADFDLKLVDLHATGTEKMDVEVSTAPGVWVSKAEYGDSGSYDWSLKHVNISSVFGKAFQLRFRANGVNSGNIMHWYVDNIHIYGVCRPPTVLAGHQNQFITSLTWHSPKCPAACGLKTYTEDDGTADDGYTAPAGYATSIAQIGNYYALAAGTAGSIKSFDGYFSSNSSSSAQTCQIYVYDAAHTQIGVSAPFTNTGDVWPSGTWDHITTAGDIAYSGPFYAMVDMFVASGTSKNFFDLDHTTAGPTGLGFGWANIDGTWTYAVQSSIWAGADPAATFLERINVCENGGKKDAPTTYDLSNMPASQYVPTPNSGIDHHAGANLGSTNGNVVGTPAPIAPESPMGSLLMGYNVYRADLPAGTNWQMIHNGTDTTYQDHHLSTYWGPGWKYYVTALFQDSLNPGTTLCAPASDTITIMFPATGIDQLTNSISLYPNPANDLVNVVSTNDIKTIEVLDYIGKTIYRNDDVNLKNTKLDVANYNSGVYFVKITTTVGVKTIKLTVTH
jgi:hypothetical protein